MLARDIQIALFSEIKNRTKNNQHPIFDLSELLGISNDSVYRRLRGETFLNIEEITKLCYHYGISLDVLFGFQNNELAMFTYKTLVTSKKDIVQYLTNTALELKRMIQFKNRRIIYAATDVPIFQLFKFPELAMFKIYMWMNTMLPAENQINDFIKFSADKELRNILSEIVFYYNLIDSVDIYTDYTIVSLLKSIEFYFVSNNKASAIEFELIMKQLNKLINEIELQLNTSNFDNKDKVGTKKHEIYLSEIELENCYILSKVDDLSRVTVKLFSLNSMNTSNEAFCHETETWLLNVLSKSTLISGSAQKLRMKFIKSMRDKVDISIARISSETEFKIHSPQAN